MHAYISDNTKNIWQFYAKENDNTNCVTDMKDTSNKVVLVACLRNW